ncbi:MAG: RNA ligase [Hyperthermus sp.]|nr:MAG: RNA ligase [Hyperthermus sp.]
MVSGWVKPEPWMLDTVADTLGMSRDRVERLASRRIIRFRSFRGLLYASLKREVSKYPEGTVVIIGRGWGRLIYGYPPIRRIVLPEVALPKYFIDKVVVEEKLNGYNVRVVMLDDHLYALTRGGYICPYTTSRIDRELGEKLRELLFELGPEDHVVAGEVVGLENPYTRHYYREAPKFGYFVFDILRGDHFLPPRFREEMTAKHGISQAPILAVIDKNDMETFRTIIDRLEREGREGVVLKDPSYRVRPLKYTTHYTNIEDIRIGMKFFFEEGMEFVKSRLLREIFMAYSKKLEEDDLEKLALELGMAALKPAIDAVREVAAGESIYEEFTLVFNNYAELKEFIEYMSEMGVNLTLIYTKKNREGIAAKLRKIRETSIHIRRILETGLAPID